MSKGTEEDRREFEVNGVKYYLASPTADDIRLSDWMYSKTYNKALVEDIATSSEMEEILRKRGILSEEYDAQVERVKDEIGKKVVDMELSSDKDERKRLAEEVAELREELFRLNQKVNGPMSNTIENMSDDARLECLTSCIVQKEDGSRVWDSYEDYCTENDRDVSFRARFETMVFLQGLEPDFLEKAPERVVMREIAAEEEKTVEEGAKEEKTKAKPRRKASVRKTTRRKKKTEE